MRNHGRLAYFYFNHTDDIAHLFYVPAAADGPPCSFSGTIKLDDSDTSGRTLITATIERDEYHTHATEAYGSSKCGKTQIYIKLIEEQIMQGKQVLYLLPEIALTAQTIRRLQKHFGGYIAIYHSKFNLNERVEIWNKVKSGDIKVVLGARSALFLPFRELGMIITDEEHDASYKQQEPAPRYHARDTAIYYASLFGAKVLLGSATPSVESYFNSMQDKYGLVTLAERFGDAGLPASELSDIKKYPAKPKPVFTPPLIDAIQASLEAKKQVKGLFHHA